MKLPRWRLNYSNVVATAALFVALGGVSYAAVHLPKESVGTAQLKNGAVSTAKTRNGAITNAKIADSSISTSKLADQAVTGAKVDVATLGTVPKASAAADAQNAAHADQANRANEANLATEAKHLGTLSAGSFGGPLIAHTDIPATTSDQEWWIPVSGMGKPSHSLKNAEMLLPDFDPLYADGFVAFSWTGPSPEDAAKVHISLHNFEEEEPFHHWEVDVTRLAYNRFTTGGVESNSPPGRDWPTALPRNPTAKKSPPWNYRLRCTLAPALDSRPLPSRRLDRPDPPGAHVRVTLQP